MASLGKIKWLKYEFILKMALKGSPSNLLPHKDQDLNLLQILKNISSMVAKSYAGYDKTIS